jgi:hypothetical protein
VWLARTALAALVGFAMVGLAAAVLQAVQRHAGGSGLKQLGPAVDLVLVWVFVLPVLGWVPLRIVGVRPAWAVAILGPVLMLPILVAFDRPGGLHRTAWAYGLQGALAYALSAALMLGVAAALRPRR